MAAGRHDLDFSSNIVHVTVLEVLEIHDFDGHFLTAMWRLGLSTGRLPN